MEIREIDIAHGICLIYNLLLPSSRDNDDLSIGFHRSVEVQETELAYNITTKGNYHVRKYLKIFFCFAEHQTNCTYGLGCKLSLERNIDNHVINNPAGAYDAAKLGLAGRVVIEDISLYVLLCTPNILNQKLMLRHVVSRAATELSYSERSSFMKNVTTEIN